ncbi:MAG TPA: hypothetical protein VGQ32_10405 [Thermoanaerobaculia bacterium]|nr:hypothetical protein [Thermoanaerobaculia bacterium]
MTTIERPGSLASGFSAIVRGGGGGIVLLLAAATIALSVLATAPLGPSFEESFGRTLAGDQMIHNDPLFAGTNFADFLHEKGPAVAGANAAMKWAALLILLQQILAAGGIVAVLGKAGGFTAGEFAWGVRRNAWHNVKCFLIFLLLAGVAIGAWLGGIAALSKKAFENAAPGAAAPLAVRIAAIVVALLLYAVFSLLHDFARAARRFDNSVGAWRSYGRARRTLSGRWLRALGLFSFWLIFGAALLAAGIALEWTSPAVSALAIFLHILIQIAVLSIRPFIRVAAWGSYLALYDRIEDERVAPVAPAPPKPLITDTLEDHPLV